MQAANKYEQYTQVQRETGKMKVRTAMRYIFFSFQMPYFIYQARKIVLAKVRENIGSVELC